MSLPQRHEQDTRAEPITDVLARIQVELEDIARRIDHNQAAIARTTWAAGAADHDYVKAMQDADLSAQRIAGVADFLHAIRSASHPDWRIDTSAATGVLKLTELVRAIGSTSEAIERKNEAAAGNVDLF